jgi:peptidoglycan/LPS O-acetylase OafA/YrhL
MTVVPTTASGAVPASSDTTGHNANNFDFLRFAAATAVMYSHGFAITAMGGQEPMAVWTHGNYTFGGLSVRIFFVISGFLVTTSWLRSPRIIPFASARALRIFPALAVALVYCLLIGLITTTLKKRHFLADPDTWNFFWSNVTLRTSFVLPGVFHANPLPDAVNGSLWSLFYEFRAYVIVLCIGIAGLMRRPAIGVAAWLAAALLTVFYPDAWGMVIDHDWPVINACLCFVGGALLALYPRIARWRGLGIVAIAAAIAVPFTLGTPYSNVPMDIALIAGVLWLAYRRIPHLQNFGRFGDFSYGIFIYAFPTQQLMAWLGIGAHDVYVNFAAAFPATLLLAMFSWHCVERPCRDLKRHFRKTPRITPTVVTQ